jgi:2-oxoglutarate dehydrogenase E1 component
VAIARVEQLYPFPAQELGDLVASYPRLREVVWLQEEPQNMGAWDFLSRQVAGLRYVGRPAAASPAEGWTEAHVAEQRRIISEVLEGVPAHAG